MTWETKDSGNAGTSFVTKDSGKREERPSGYVRDTQDGKPRFGLLVPLNVPYEHTMLYRDAMLAARGAEKYSPRNNELSNDVDDLDRFKESAYRHFMQWFCGEEDEDHAAAARWNIRQHEELKWRLESASEGPIPKERDSAGVRGSESREGKRVST